MRLICPECNALYDIADAMIPPEGRDVECSACGHVWLQRPAPAAPVRPAAPEPALPDPAAPAAGQRRDAPRSATMRGLAADLRAAAQEHDDSAPTLGAAPVLQRPLPDDVLSILREETARELGARRSAREGGAPGPVPDAAPVPTAVAPQPMTTPAVPDTPAQSPADEPQTDWPATTVTRPDLSVRADSRPDQAPAPAAPVAEVAPVIVVPIPAPPSAPASAPSPVPPQDAAPEHPPERPPVPRRRVPRGLPDAEKLAATIQTEIPPPVAVPATVPVVTKPAQPGYRTGFSRAVLVAAALLLAYVAGAAWVQSGRAPGVVVSAVGGVDHLRAGLQDAVSAVLGRKEP